MEPKQLTKLNRKLKTEMGLQVVVDGIHHQKHAHQSLLKVLLPTSVTQHQQSRLQALKE